MQDPKNRHLGTIAQLCRAISSQLRHVSTIGKKLVKQQYLLHVSLQYRELRPTSSWDRFVTLRHPSKFQRVSRLGCVTAWHSSTGRQRNFVALNIRRHLYLAGQPSRWALAHILIVTVMWCMFSAQQHKGSSRNVAETVLYWSLNHTIQYNIKTCSAPYVTRMLIVGAGMTRD